MIRSMTGFGAAEGEVGSGRVSVEVRSVNHRFFSPSIKLPGVLARWEGDVREAMRRGVSRGHVTLFARFERDVESNGALPLDEARFAAYVTQLRAVEAKYELGQSLDLATMLRLPDLMVSNAREELTAEALPQVIAVVDKAVEALLQMRAAEGTRLVAFRVERLAIIEVALDRIAERAPSRVIEQRDRLRTAVRELSEGVSVDESRLAQEIALLADRLDVKEELSRFHAHIDAFRGALASPQPDGVGKRLGFLLQEMLREANTTGSKGNDAAIVHGNLYGTLRSEVERVLASGRHVVMDIDVQGASQFMRAFPESVTIFILPPSADVLLERLRSRKTETPSQLAARLQSALQELQQVGEYEYVVVNDDLERAVASVNAIIDAEIVSRERVKNLRQQVAELIAQLEREIENHTP